MKRIRNPANISHRTTRIIEATVIRGDIRCPSERGGWDVPVAAAGTGVIVGIEVSVTAGKIKVNAGNGSSVVVGVGEAVDVGV